MKIASVCTGIVELIKKKFPGYKKNLVKVDSPMIAMGKVCKKTYEGYDVVFVSPCGFKKREASNSKYVDHVINYKELEKLLKKYNVLPSSKKIHFDKFYNDYTKIYPVSGGLFKTARLKGIVKKDKAKIKDGLRGVVKILEKKSEKNYQFLDITFCTGGCIGGPSVMSDKSIKKRKKAIKNYLKKAKKENIPEPKKGLIEHAKGISFRNKCF